jgi:hypothetical protein
MTRAVANVLVLGNMFPSRWLLEGMVVRKHRPRESLGIPTGKGGSKNRIGARSVGVQVNLGHNLEYTE